MGWWGLINGPNGFGPRRCQVAFTCCTFASSHANQVTWIAPSDLHNFGYKFLSITKSRGLSHCAQCAMHFRGIPSSDNGQTMLNIAQNFFKTELCQISYNFKTLHKFCKVFKVSKCLEDIFYSFSCNSYRCHFNLIVICLLSYENHS